MQKKFIFLFSFIILPNMAPCIITENIADGCNNEILGIHNSVSIEAVFEPINITCISGQYLRANSVTCSTCPNEAVCNGGTYTFNETRTQGVVFNNPISQNKTNGCIPNLLGVSNEVLIEAVFEPNNVNLTLDYGTGNTSTTNCTYDGLIILPNEPTRAGYTFQGWKLQSNQQP